MKPRNNIELSELQEQRKAIHKKINDEANARKKAWKKLHSRNGKREKKVAKCIVKKFTDEEFKADYYL
jgi:hypothetical protein